MLASGARLLGMLSCTVSLLGCRVRGLDSGGDSCFGVGCMACRRVRCLVFDATVGSKGCIVNVMLAWGARMLGMLSCALSLLGC